MILVHETSFNILIHFLSEKRIEIKQNMIPYKNYKTPYLHYFLSHIITVSQYNVERQYIYVLFFES